MTWQLRVEHTTGFRYERPVVSSYNEARIIPQTGLRQVTVEAEVRTYPPAPIFRYWDYWGTLVAAFDLHVPHQELSVTGRSVVESSPPAAVPPDAPSWADLRGGDVTDRFVELLAPTSYSPTDRELVSVGRELAARYAPAELIPAAADWVRGALEYQPGTTGVHTSAVQAWRAGKGVCQDFAHLCLALLRAAGLPSRYVSGYLHPVEDAQVGETVVGQSHAWIEGWLGDWWGYDPTNGIRVGERHVVVARGRDYKDVPPLHGVYSGGPSSALGVTVAVTRLR